MPRDGSRGSVRALLLAGLLVLTPVIGACSVSPQKPCTNEGSLISFHDRHPDLGLRSWRGIAQESLDSATCLHEAADLHLFAVDVYETDEWVSFAVDFDNGYLYNQISVRTFSSDPFNEPDVVLPAEALAELREAIDRYQVLDWPSRDPGETTYVGEYVNPNKFMLAVVFSDDTGSFADQQTASDPDMVGFLKFAQSFLAEHVE